MSARTLIRHFGTLGGSGDKCVSCRKSGFWVAEELALRCAWGKPQDHVHTSTANMGHPANTKTMVNLCGKAESI